MALFDPPRYASHIPLYQGAPVDEVKALVQKKEQDYYGNLDLFDKTKIALSNIDLNPANEPLRQELVNNVQTAIQSFAEKGDYENAGYLARKLATDVASNPDLQRAMANQREYRKWETQLNDALLKKNITPDLYQYAKNKTTFNPELVDENGAPYVFQGYMPPNYFDVDNYLRGIISGVQPEFWASKGITMDVDPNDPEKVLFYKRGEEQAMSKERVAKILSGALKNNPEARAYMKAMQEHTGINDYDAMVEATVEPYAEGAQYERDSSKFWLGNVNQINAMDRQHRQIKERMKLGFQQDAYLTGLKNKGKNGVPFPDFSQLGQNNGKVTFKMPLSPDKLKTLVNRFQGGFFSTFDPYVNNKFGDFSEEEKQIYDFIASNNKDFDPETGILNINGNTKIFDSTEDYLNSSEGAQYVNKYVQKYGERPVNINTVNRESLPSISAEFERENEAEANYLKASSLENYVNDLEQYRVIEITDDQNLKIVNASDEFTLTGKKQDKFEVRGMLGTINPFLYMLGQDGKAFVNGVIIKNKETGKRYVVERNSQDMNTPLHQQAIMLNQIYGAGFQMPDIPTYVDVGNTRLQVLFEPYENDGVNGAGNGKFTIYDPSSNQGVILNGIDEVDETGDLIINTYLQSIFQGE